MTADTLGDAGRAKALGALGLEVLFDHPVFQGMEGDDADPAPRLEELDRHGQSLLQDR